ncbi:hypothetical protein [Piscirickettsia litoralis]|uniref:Uncharacterized protein n=1 Tax=Piscirickettsia litoralis TaxID=1891921 RepID=A0ABX3A4X7_9GAMM|nr:hypothetical protein [Piscirickettsia litoralis]ODN43907.1 hypothetical protein BGC07_14705 [Piscirickettsia litoralis]
MLANGVDVDKLGEKVGSQHGDGFYIARSYEIAENFCSGYSRESQELCAKLIEENPQRFREYKAGYGFLKHDITCPVLLGMLKEKLGITEDNLHEHSSVINHLLDTLKDQEGRVLAVYLDGDLKLERACVYDNDCSDHGEGVGRLKQVRQGGYITYANMNHDKITDLDGRISDSLELIVPKEMVGLLTLEVAQESTVSNEVTEEISKHELNIINENRKQQESLLFLSQLMMSSGLKNEQKVCPLL